MAASYIESARYFDSARERGVELERRPQSRVVITGYAQTTPLGNTRETFEHLIEGRSGVVPFPLQNFHGADIAAPLPGDFDPNTRLTPLERKPASGISSRVAKMAVGLSREAMEMAGLQDETGRTKSSIHPNRRASWVGSGIADTHILINVSEGLHPNGPEGNGDVKALSAKIKPSESMQVFPEQPNGRNAIAGEFSGWGGNTMEACATGASNIIEAAEAIRSGRVDLAVAGGVEDILSNHPEVTAAVFGSLRALYKGSHKPEQASRPFDKDRAGFVMGAGGGILVLERLDDALARSATIYGEITGLVKSMDGYKPTEMNPVRVADTIAVALWDKQAKALRKPGAIFVHSTSTPVGDPLEVLALRMVFGEDLRDVPITAIKSMLGHLLGGAGSVNLVTAVQALNEGRIPQILNLESPDPEIMREGELYVVRDAPLTTPLQSVLATAFGFGGYNAAVLVEKYAA